MPRGTWRGSTISGWPDGTRCHPIQANWVYRLFSRKRSPVASFIAFARAPSRHYLLPLSCSSRIRLSVRRPSRLYASRTGVNELRAGNFKEAVFGKRIAYEWSCYQLMFLWVFSRALGVHVFFEIPKRDSFQNFSTSTRNYFGKARH